MDSFDVVIIGAGLGGLLCANILSKEGFSVCVVEKNHKPGGSLQTFGRKACIFNTGLNYTESLDTGQVLNQYFRYFGVLDRIKLQRLNSEGFEVISFPDHQYRIAMGRERFIETLSQEFPAERAALLAYTQKIHEICHSISMYTFEERLTNMLENTALQIGAADYLQSVFQNERLRNIIAGNNMLYAGSASKTPLYIHALINNSFMESAWRIADGSHTLVKALVDNIESYGGVVLCGKEVSQLVTSQGVATSVILSDGREIRGKRFIANIHPERILDLVEPGIFRKSYSNRIRRLENTMGMFTLYLVFKKNGMPYANYNFYHYNQNQVWVASDYRPDVWPQNYLLMHTAMSRSASFAESGSVITYMDHRELKAWEHTFTGNRGSDYEAFKTEKAEILIDAIEKQFPGIRSRIQAYYTSTPLTWRDYTGTKNGSAYGIIKDYKQPIESLVLPRTQVPNLFLSGQNVNVHGILGVTISAFVTCAEFIDMNYLIRKVKSS